MKAVHGIVDEKASFDSICTTVESFLTKNPTEFIIMSIKKEVESKNSSLSFEDCLKTYLESDIYLKNTAIPGLIGEIRGKVILLSRYKNSTIGVLANDGWLNSMTFTLPNGIFVQDVYRITSKEQKQEEIIKCFNENGHALKINFLSAYRTNYLIPSYAPSAALDINPWINEEISKYNDRNIVLYDFVTKENMDAFFKGVL